jgi:osmotically inducible protein OsmC
MAKRKADAIWHGDLKNGKGQLTTESGALDAGYSFSTRFEDKRGTNPEELIGAAHAGCFSQALAHELSEDGYTPEKIETQALVSLVKTDEGFKISKVELNTQVKVPDVDQEVFIQKAEGAKKNCPVSKALAGVDIILKAELI